MAETYEAPKAFRDRVRHSWQMRRAAELVAQELRGEPLEAIRIPIKGRSLSGEVVIQDLAKIREWNRIWDAEMTRHAEIVLNVREATFRVCGETWTPGALVFAEPADLGTFLHPTEGGRYKRAKSRLRDLLDIDERLISLAGKWGMVADLEHADMLSLQGLLRWRLENPRVEIRAREIPVLGMHTKWIETNLVLVKLALGSLDLLRQGSAPPATSPSLVASMMIGAGWPSGSILKTGACRSGHPSLRSAPVRCCGGRTGSTGSWWWRTEPPFFLSFVPDLAGKKGRLEQERIAGAADHLRGLVSRAGTSCETLHDPKLLRETHFVEGRNGQHSCQLT
jgi:hypothetical protein